MKRKNTILISNEFLEAVNEDVFGLGKLNS